MKNYKAYRLVECTDYDVNYGVILLHEKHNVEEFQTAIFNVKELLCKEGFGDWCIDDVLSHAELKKFDFLLYSMKNNDLVEI